MASRVSHDVGPGRFASARPSTPPVRGRAGQGSRSPYPVRGTIDQYGGVHGGSGNFTVTKLGTGTYQIVFATPFATTPSATATIWERDFPWWIQDTTHISTINTHQVVIKTCDSHYVLSDRDFTFIVIG